jgi:outer membrane protein OmpA-like peptidoglycan-associated protein
MVISENKEGNEFMQKFLFRNRIPMILIYAVSYIVGPLFSQQSEEDMNRKWHPTEMAMEGAIYFTKKSSKIQSPDLTKLQWIAEHLIANPTLSVFIKAHAWDGGNEKQEITLSEKRSLEVERFLRIHGVKETQIHRLFYGNARPLDHGLTTKDQAIQRRVEYSIVKE